MDHLNIKSWLKIWTNLRSMLHMYDVFALCFKRSCTSQVCMYVCRYVRMYVHKFSKRTFSFVSIISPAYRAAEPVTQSILLSLKSNKMWMLRLMSTILFHSGDPPEKDYLKAHILTPFTVCFLYFLNIYFGCQNSTLIVAMRRGKCGFLLLCQEQNSTTSWAVGCNIF
jgi:hypothetical protein